MMAASYPEISAALTCIPADLCRDEWWRIAAAIKNELGEAGFDLFDNWSQGGGNYQEKDVRATWQSTRPDGNGLSIKIGTLFKMAKDHGFQKAATRPVLKPTVAKTSAKSTAQSLWDEAEDCASHPYAERKGLDTAGLKKYKGKLLIPAYDAGGKMSSIQEIDKDGDKKFLQGCTMSGCWYTLPGDAVLVVAEGWATAKSIHLATGHTVIVAFSSSGFQKVPPLLRKKYPQAKIILAPDNDESQDAVKKATAAARHNGCEIIVPEVTDGSDFNDVHQASGLDEIRRQFANNARKPRLHDLTLVELKDVAPEPVSWLWPGKFALGKLVLLGGVPSTGKTTISHSIVSIVTNGGQWPFSQDKAPCGRAIILTCEDDLGDTVVPRLMAAGANLDLVTVVQSVAGQANDLQRSFVLANDLHQLDGLLRERPDTLLVVFDPLSAYLGAEDSHRDADVRAILGPLCQLAANHQVTVLGIGHLNKNEAQSAMARFMGSGGIIAAARSAYLTASINDQLMMLPVKNNLAPREQAAGLTYEIKTALVADGISTAAVEWTGEADMWAEEALAQESAKNRTPKMLSAKEFICDQLRDGPKRQVEIEKDALDQGHSVHTLKRARIDLGYVSKKDGFSAGWKWYTADQWTNYQEVHGAKNTAQDTKNTKGHGILRSVEKVPEKVPIAQPPEFGILRDKSTTTTGVKPNGSKGFTEECHAPGTNGILRSEESTEKQPEDTKNAKSIRLGETHFSDTSEDTWETI